jgi:hypothetical protein
MAKSSLVFVAVFATATSLATQPLRSIEVTPRNESKYPFSVVLSGRGESRTMIVIAPGKLSGDCLPEFAGTELRTIDEKLVYSQTVTLGHAKTDHEIHGEIGSSSHSLRIWLNYICPEPHMDDGARYEFSSVEWEKSGRMR